MFLPDWEDFTETRRNHATHGGNNRVYLNNLAILIPATLASFVSLLNRRQPNNLGYPWRSDFGCHKTLYAIRVY